MKISLVLIELSASKSRNSPFHGWPLKEAAVAAVDGGKIAWMEK